jgi:hypothetical protein
MLKDEIIERLKKGEIQLPQLQFAPFSFAGVMPDMAFDAVIKMKWDRVEEKFVVQVKSLSTPKSIMDAILSVKALSMAMKLNPLVLVPYLSDEAISRLEGVGVSGIDLCGNALIIVPGKLYYSRTGNKNQFPNTAPIKNIYSKNSSLVGRLFLVKPKFNKVGEILDEINLRMLPVFKGDGLSLATVSKCLKSMEQDLIAGRNDLGIRLLQADKLLAKLSGNYSPPKIGEIINWEIPASDTVIKVLPSIFKCGVPAVVTGSSSAIRYSVMQGSETISIYSADPGALLDGIPGRRNDRFPSLSFIRTADMPAYFDCRTGDDGIRWASPVQSYCELMAGDKRDQETALQVREYILTAIKEYKHG